MLRPDACAFVLLIFQSRGNQQSTAFFNNFSLNMVEIITEDTLDIGVPNAFFSARASKNGFCHCSAVVLLPQNVR